MFDLNNEIKKWRRDLAQSESLGKSDIDELESHLREELERLTALKLSEQEAFWIARHRLGDIHSLAEEFAKINTSMLWRKRLYWAGAIVLAWLIVTYIGQVTSRACVLLASLAGVRGYTLNIVDTLSQVIFFGTAAFVLYRISKEKDMQGDLLCKIADNFWGKVVLFASVFVIAAAMFASETFIPVVTVRLLHAQEIGQMLMLRKCKELIWIISAPLALLIGTILIRPSRFRKVEA